MFCREHALQLHRDREKFEEAGVSLVVIGQGEPHHAAHFIDEYGLDGLRILVDKDRETYERAGAKVATYDELWGPKVVARGIAAAARNSIRQGKTQGHAAQLGGVLIVDADGRIAYAHMSEDASDNPPNEEVLEAARKAAGAG